MVRMLFPPWLLQLDMAGEEPIPVTAALGQRLQSHCVLASLFARASLRAGNRFMDPSVTLAAILGAATSEPGAPGQDGSHYCCCDST